MNKPCSEIILKKRQLCWAPPEGWGMTHEEMCRKCQEMYKVYLEKVSQRLKGR